MPDLKLSEFERYLLRAGVGPKNAKRFTAEMTEHLEDLCEDAVAEGLSTGDALELARTRIGNLQSIATEIISRPELRSWPFRYRRTAGLILPVTYILLLPARPLFAGVANASHIARWGTCLVLGAVVTAGLFLAMQLSIALG